MMAHIWLCIVRNTKRANNLNPFNNRSNFLSHFLQLHCSHLQFHVTHILYMDVKCVYVKITQTKNNKLEKDLSQVQGLNKAKRGGVNKQKKGNFLSSLLQTFHRLIKRKFYHRLFIESMK
jgi:hypothetical protein